MGVAVLQIAKEARKIAAGLEPAKNPMNPSIKLRTSKTEIEQSLARSQSMLPGQDSNLRPTR